MVDLGTAATGLVALRWRRSTVRWGAVAPDVENPEQLKAFFDAIQSLNRQGLLLAYHDRSDGGLFVTLAEMALPVALDCQSD